MALGGADARHLVRGDRHADACAAQQDRARKFAGRDALRDFDRDIGIQHRLVRAVRAEVDQLELGVRRAQVPLDRLLERVGRFVAADRHFHGEPPEGQDECANVQC